jgi:hypothetical protein
MMRVGASSSSFAGKGLSCRSSPVSSAPVRPAVVNVEAKRVCQLTGEVQTLKITFYHYQWLFWLRPARVWALCLLCSLAAAQAATGHYSRLQQQQHVRSNILLTKAYRRGYHLNPSAAVRHAASRAGSQAWPELEVRHALEQQQHGRLSSRAS